MIGRKVYYRGVDDAFMFGEVTSTYEAHDGTVVVVTWNTGTQSEQRLDVLLHLSGNGTWLLW